MYSLVVKLFCLFSFTGGPLYLTDLLKPHLGDLSAFIIAFTPVALLGIGALSVHDDDGDWLSSIAVMGGLLGGAALTAENSLAIWNFMAGVHHPNQVMISLGIAMGIVGVVAYSHLALSFLRRQQQGGFTEG